VHDYERSIESMSTFEDNLWDELVREHQAEYVHPVRATTSGPARRRLLVGMSLGLAGAATATALALTAGTVAPAFAVTSNPNGTVTVTISQIAGISGANTELAALGVRATAIPIVQGCTAALQRLPKAASGGILSQPSSGPLQSITIEPSAIPAGDTVVLAAAQNAGAVQMTDAVVQGVAPACVAPALGHKALQKALP
jgi:hypothetical protein